jgi:membrane-associated phospholipid phosphatase
MTRPRTWPVDRLHVGYFGLQAALTVAAWARLPGAAWWLAFDLGALALLAIVVAATDPLRPKRSAMLRLAHGCLVIPLVFTQTGLLIGALRTADYAAVMERADRALFGGTNPIERLERFASPWLTELMQWAYTAYVLLPVVAVVLLAAKATPPMIARSLFSLLLVFYLSYIGYYLVPTSGPNLHNNLVTVAPAGVRLEPLYRFESPLPGTWMAERLRAAMAAVELTKKDCFPSGHVAIAVACLAYAFRIGRAWGWLCLPVTLGVVLSTMYLRYHYVVDVIAGIALALFCVTFPERWHRRREPLLFSWSSPDTREPSIPNPH